MAGDRSRKSADNARIICSPQGSSSTKHFDILSVAILFDVFYNLMHRKQVCPRQELWRRNDVTQYGVLADYPRSRIAFH